MAAFLRQVRPEGLIVEGLTAERIESMRTTCGKTPFMAALPPVFFEDEISAIRALLAECRRRRVPVEVNSWGGWHLARQAGVRMESGPGLPVLNSLAARTLADLGVRCVTLSPEADRKQLEELSANCSASCSLVVFGRPALLTTPPICRRMNSSARFWRIAVGHVSRRGGGKGCGSSARSNRTICAIVATS